MMTITQTIATHLSQYIDTEFFNGRQPHIKGRRVPVWVIAYAARGNGWGVADLMENFTLSEPEVIAALLYYDDHADEIDAERAATHAQYPNLDAEID